VAVALAAERIGSLDAANTKIVALAGGVGGAKLADGLAQVLQERLTVIVNTGDDFEHLGLHISPDLDTVMYTLAGIANPVLGWGIAGETWTFMEQVSRLGGADWFRLGDRDLATHAIRTSRLKAGDTLSMITGDLCAAFKIAARVLPMTDDAVRTTVHSGDRVLAFQDYFVRLRCEVPVTRLFYQGTASARLNREVALLTGPAAPTAIIICPSNPYLSIEPILAVPGMREWIAGLGVPVVAVSPIVGGAAIKGPAAKIMQELGANVSAAGVADRYRGLIDGIIIDRVDHELRAEIEAMGIAVMVTQTVMMSSADRANLARDCLALAAELAGARKRTGAG
jgi:LPPG:FO 2-phospho-L-lactate transferase